MVAQVFYCVVVTTRDCLPKRSFGLCEVVQVQSVNVSNERARSKVLKNGRLLGSNLKPYLLIHAPELKNARE